MSMSQETIASGSALHNVTYDLVTILHEQSKGLEAYDKYMKDAQGNQQLSSLLQQLRQQDQQAVQQLKQQVQQILTDSGN